MTRRWSLIVLIAVLAGALAFVVVHIVTGEEPSGKTAGGKKPAAEKSGGGDAALEGRGWWPLHGSGAAGAGEQDVTVRGSHEWLRKGPDGGGLDLDGATGYAASTEPVVDTDGDYSVAARVRLDEDAKGRMRTAVSQSGERTSAFFLQYSAPDRKFAFSFGGARATAEAAGEPQSGRWYHLTGTYRKQDHRMTVYVDGKKAGERQAVNRNESTGGLEIGRGRFRGAGADYWKGGVADVHVFDRELGADEVKSLSAREPG